jgi:predicted dehydrogenase
MGEHGALAGGGVRTLHQLPGWPQPAERVGEPVHTFTAAVGHFLDVVQRSVPNLAPFAVGARALQLTTAAYRSAAEGRAMALPEDPLLPPQPAGDGFGEKLDATLALATSPA